MHLFRTGLFSRLRLPMIRGRGTANMQITVTISDAIVREAGTRGLAVIDFVESLIDKGMLVAAESKERPVLSSAIERIRALRTATVEPTR
jgi:hypothetical protein